MASTRCSVCASAGQVFDFGSCNDVLCANCTRTAINSFVVPEGKVCCPRCQGRVRAKHFSALRVMAPFNTMDQKFWDAASEQLDLSSFPDGKVTCPNCRLKKLAEGKHTCYTAPLPPTPVEDCGICMSCPGEVQVGASCRHWFCRQCIVHWLNTILQSGGNFPAICPSCHANDSKIDRSALDKYPGRVRNSAIKGLVDRKYIDEKTLVRFEAQQALAGIDKKMLCNCPACTAVNLKPDDDEPRARCVCGVDFCANCCVRWNANHKCGEEPPLPNDSKHDQKANDEKSSKLISEIAKKCPRCSAPIIHYKGHHCHHITPRRADGKSGCPNCSHEFCYTCLKPWHTCECPLYCSQNKNPGGCGCPICPDCKPGKPCQDCEGPADCCPACNAPASDGKGPQ